MVKCSIDTLLQLLAYLFLYVNWYTLWLTNSVLTVTNANTNPFKMIGNKCIGQLFKCRDLSYLKTKPNKGCIISFGLQLLGFPRQCKFPRRVNFMVNLLCFLWSTRSHMKCAVMKVYYTVLDDIKIRMPLLVKFWFSTRSKLCRIVWIYFLLIVSVLVFTENYLNKCNSRVLRKLCDFLIIYRNFVVYDYFAKHNTILGIIVPIRSPARVT